jgi:pimeloyl-ACP methyl ester carboxylesterase
MFLGVGCVRHLIALYDQLALVYGLRLICIDRWGYGKTDQVDQVDRGVLEWACVLGQVMRKLNITKFQVIAHSAGVPYAMAMARRYPDMIRGRMHLLAPWVGQDHETGMSPRGSVLMSQYPNG